MSIGESVADGVPVRLVRRPGVVDIVLDRPEKRNAVSAGMVRALHTALTAAERENARVITLRGAGEHFCAGADIALYSHGDGATIETFIRSARDLCDRLETSDAMTIAIVDGSCLGGGFELALACDLVLATDRARFGFPEIRLGLMPGWGGTQRLTRAIGRRRALELITSGATVDGTTARQWGLVNRLCTHGELADRARDYGDDLAGRAAPAVRAAKRVVGLAGSGSGAEAETTELMELFSSSEGIEGVAAFLEKRAPRFNP